MAQNVHKVAGVLATALAVLKIAAWLLGGGRHYTTSQPMQPLDPPAKPSTVEAQRQKAEQDKQFADFMKTVRELQAGEAR